MHDRRSAQQSASGNLTSLFRPLCGINCLQPWLPLRTSPTLRRIGIPVPIVSSSTSSTHPYIQSSTGAQYGRTRNLPPHPFWWPQNANRMNTPSSRLSNSSGCPLISLSTKAGTSHSHLHTSTTSTRYSTTNFIPSFRRSYNARFPCSNGS